MIKLRPYQEDILNQARKYMRQGIKKILIEAPTGAGKTVIASEMLRICKGKSMRAAFMMHRRELVKQSSETLEKFGLDHGVISAGFKENLNEFIQVNSIQTLVRKKDVEPFQLIIWDEAHHCASASWDKLFKQYPNAFHILLTATPERLDGKGLKDYADVMIEGPKIQWLIDNGYLCDYDIYAPSNVSLKGTKIRFGDFAKGEMVEIIDNPTITGDAIKEYKKLAIGKRAVIFCVTVEHSEHVVKQFNEAGIIAVHIDGNTPTAQRDYLLNEFKEGRIHVVSNVALFGEGFDLPALEVLIMLRPTASMSLYRQMCGRVLRMFEGKLKALILDHVGNAKRHGLPCTDIKWSLEGREKKKRDKDGTAPVRTCERCFLTQPSMIKTCQSCGFVFKITEREITEAEGELAKLNKEKMKLQQKREKGAARTLEDLIALGKSRGYKNPHAWASHIYHARKNKRGKNN